MDRTKVAASDPGSVEAVLREELARGDSMLSAATPLLHHLLAHEDQMLFGDEVVARVRGMLTDLARQLLFAQARAARLADGAGFAEERTAHLVAALGADRGILGHLHVLVVEGRLTRKLQERNGLDPVLSPLLQDLVAAEDDRLSAAAMAAIAAQARFVQQEQRMALPLGELPGDLLYAALAIFRQTSSGAGAAIDALHAAFDESLGRLELLRQLVSRMGREADRALDLDRAGLAMFATALSVAADLPRDVTVLSFSDRQFVRFALALRTAGLKGDMFAAQVLQLHPGAVVPEGFDDLSAERASTLLAASRSRGGG